MLSYLLISLVRVLPHTRRRCRPKSWMEDYAELVKRLRAENCASTGVLAPVSQRWLLFLLRVVVE